MNTANSQMDNKYGNVIDKGSCIYK
jgi:hypothetical protein